MCYFQNLFFQKAGSFRIFCSVPHKNNPAKDSSGSFSHRNVVFWFRGALRQPGYKILKKEIRFQLYTVLGKEEIKGLKIIPWIPTVMVWREEGIMWIWILGSLHFSIY